MLCRAVSRLHTNNHGEIDSIFDAANYLYFLKGQSFLENLRGVYRRNIHRSFLFLILSNGNILSFILKIFKNLKITNKKS